MNASRTHEASSHPSKKAKTACPYDLYMERLKAYQEENDFMGQLLVRGIPRRQDDSDDEEEDGDGDTSKFTSEQMEGLHYVLINKERADALETMEKLILGEQYGGSFLMFNTSFSYDVRDCYNHNLTKMLSRKPNSTKFNLLFAFTYTLKQYDTWMHDHEGLWGTKGSCMIASLAKRWKALLKKPDLMVDEQYTLPAVKQFLRDFKNEVENIEVGYDGEEVVFKFE